MLTRVRALSDDSTLFSTKPSCLSSASLPQLTPFLSEYLCAALVSESEISKSGHDSHSSLSSSHHDYRCLAPELTACRISYRTPDSKRRDALPLVEKTSVFERFCSVRARGFQILLSLGAAAGNNRLDTYNAQAIVGGEGLRRTKWNGYPYRACSHPRPPTRKRHPEGVRTQTRAPLPLVSLLRVVPRVRWRGTSYCGARGKKSICTSTEMMRCGIDASRILNH
ncbi:hypothetical protein R3P38DRAFT_893923 [Favolaschia claudopus]|uniref:Uncharacterized protein n=1 Tax=Favolaschia claudopus TaxID=2862362 RepID=A0AAW0BVN1_9AGAR